MFYSIGMISVNESLTQIYSCIASIVVLALSGALASANSRTFNEGHNPHLTQEMLQEARNMVENTKRVIVEEMTHMVC